MNRQLIMTIEEDGLVGFNILIYILLSILGVIILGYLWNYGIISELKTMNRRQKEMIDVMAANMQGMQKNMNMIAGELSEIRRDDEIRNRMSGTSGTVRPEEENGRLNYTGNFAGQKTGHNGNYAGNSAGTGRRAEDRGNAGRPDSYGGYNGPVGFDR